LGNFKTIYLQFISITNENIGKSNSQINLNSEMKISSKMVKKVKNSKIGFSLNSLKSNSRIQPKLNEKDFTQNYK